ncbi:pentapeptide repeat-containing protein (plasmid) [Halobacterium sp. MBLA0001]|uniref:pentapeptide repeat-containing protein n=1 Tax=Halobacterium sp. MBLA0001 TaxID=3413511 RepID=UPI003C770DFA
MTDREPPNRCGYTWPEDHDIDHDPDRQSSCYRETTADVDRCIWHADPEKVEEKSIEKLRSARAPPEIRDLNEPVAELLDGALMSNQVLGDGFTFHQTKLRMAKFTEANLQDADFSEADLEGKHIHDRTDFSGADLEGADFSDAIISKTAFLDTTLRYSDLSGTHPTKKYHVDFLSEDARHLPVTGDFENADLTGADVSEADLPRVNLSAAELTDVNLSGASLLQSTLEGAVLHQTSLKDADLRCADFTDASLEECDLSNASLGGGDLSTACFDRNKFSETTMFGADVPEGLTDDEMSGVHLNISDLVRNSRLSRRLKRNLSDTYLKGIDCSDLSLTGANLSGAFLKDAKIGRARDVDFTRASLRNADLTEDDESGFHSIEKSKSDFSGAQLRGADLSGSTLSRAQFHYAQLGEADFSDAVIDGADFTNAFLWDTDFSGANLTGADFTDVQCHLYPKTEFSVDFSGARLGDTSFSGAELPEADFSGIWYYSNQVEDGPDFSDAILHRAEFSEATLVDAIFSGAETTEATFGGAYLNDADLSGADFGWTELAGVPLLGADLSEANLTGADLSDVMAGESVDSEAANFSHATLEDADLSEASLKNANFSGARCSDANFRGANLEMATFDDAVLQEASLTGADCERAGFQEAVLVRTSLEGADLVGANLARAHLFGAVLDGARISSETQLVEEGSIGEMQVAHYLRYDTDSPPDGPEASLAIEMEGLEDMEEDLQIIQLRRARSAYRRLEELARQNGFPTLQSTMFKRRQEMRRKLLKENGDWTRWLFAEVQRWTFVYGESFSRILSISGLVIGLFWILYLTTGTMKQAAGSAVTIDAVNENPLLLITALFHSVSVFFTGTPVLEAAGQPGEFLMVIEAMFGPILLALLVFVLGRRAAR